MVKCRDAHGYVYSKGKWHRSSVFPDFVARGSSSYAGAAGELNDTGECSLTGLKARVPGRSYGTQALALLLEEYHQKGCRRLATNVLTDAGEATVKRFLRWGILGAPVHEEDPQEMVPSWMGRGYYCDDEQRCNWKWELNPGAVAITERELGCTLEGP